MNCSIPGWRRSGSSAGEYCRDDDAHFPRCALCERVHFSDLTQHSVCVWLAVMYNTNTMVYTHSYKHIHTRVSEYFTHRPIRLESRELA